MKRYAVAFIAVAAFAGALRAGEPPLALSDILKRVQDANPEIIAARQTWRVKRSEITPAGTWENPTFSYADENFPSGAAGVPAEKIKHYRIEQMIPFPGKLSGDAKMKYHEALIAEANFQAKMLEILMDARMRYYQLYLTDQKIILAHQSLDLLKDALKTAQARVGSNQSSASDVFMAQTELGKMKNELLEQEQEHIMIQIELNTLLNQPTETVLGTTQPPELADLPLPVADIDALARENDPDYLSAMHEINHAKAMLSRNRLEFAPDFGFMYEQEETPDGPAGRQIGFSVSFPLWFQRPWKEYQGAKEHVLEAQAMSQRMENEVVRTVHVEYTETNMHLQLARNYLSEILPAALSNVKIAREQYASGDGDFVRLLEAFRTWIDVHNAYQEQLYQYGEHWSELERWVGVDLSQPKATLEQEKSIPQENHHH